VNYLRRKLREEFSRFCARNREANELWPKGKA